LKCISSPVARLCAVALLGVAGVAMAAPVALASSPDVESQLAALVSADRTSAGLLPLVVDASLTGIARRWSDHLLATSTLAHNPSLGAELPSDWLAFGENVGVGHGAAALNTAFLASAPHRANILGDYNRIGVGVSTAPDGRDYVTLDFEKVAGSVSTASSPRAPLACGPTRALLAPDPRAGAGYQVLGDDGGVFAFGRAPFLGSVPGLGVDTTATHLALTPDQRGYWVLGADGGVFSFGDAHYEGSVPAIGAHTAAVSLVPTPSGLGYWVLGRDGSVFSFGDAPRLALSAGTRVIGRAVDLVATRSGRGYWVLDAQGRVTSVGDARPHGSLPTSGIEARAVSMAATSSGNGYWVLGSDGGVFSFGDARYHGSVPGQCASAQGVGLVATSTGSGYYVLAGDGRVFGFGDAPAYGDPSALHVATTSVAADHG